MFRIVGKMVDTPVGTYITQPCARNYSLNGNSTFCVEFIHKVSEHLDLQLYKRNEHYNTVPITYSININSHRTSGCEFRVTTLTRICGVGTCRT
jgi:hypothetical protein